MKPFTLAAEATGMGSTRLKRVAMTLLLTALLLAGHFIVQHRLDRPSPIPIDGQLRQWEYAHLDAPTLEEAATADWIAAETTLRLDSSAPGPAYYAFRTVLTFEQRPQAPIAIGLAMGVDNTHAYLNGSAIYTPGRLEFPAPYYSRTRELLNIPPGLIQPGDNTLLLLTTTNHNPDVALFTAIYGDYQAIAHATRLKRFLWNDYRNLTTVIALVLGVCAVAVSPQMRNRSGAFWLAALCFSIAGRSFTWVYLGPYGGDFMRFTLIYLLSAAVPFSLFMFIEAWTRTVAPRLHVGAGLAYLAAATALVIILLRDISGGVAAADVLSDLMMISASAAACLRLGWHIIKSEDLAPVETAALCVVAVLSLWDSVFFLIADRDAGHLRLIAPVLLIGLVSAILARNIKIFESLGAFTDELSAQLADREARIRADFEALTAARKARDLAEERQRILRDMHDGIGGHLTGLIVQVRARRMGMDEVERDLEQALNDLKLVVASLDTEPRSFAEAVRDLRARVARQLAARDIQLDWSSSDTEELEFSTTETLQICRIIQESVTNVLRHSDARHVSISLRGSAEGGLRIQIQDNGSQARMPGPDGAGRGLRSMSSRAASMGGQARFEASEAGFLVDVTVRASARVI